MICPKCGSKQIVRFGFIPTVKGGGKKQRYRCEKGHTFYAPAKRRVKIRRSKRGR